MIQIGSKVEYVGPAHIKYFEKHKPYTVKSIFENPQKKEEILLRLEEVRLPLVFEWCGPEKGVDINYFREMKSFDQAIAQLYSYEPNKHTEHGIRIEQDAIDKMINGSL